jgi:hypothetical protein
VEVEPARFTETPRPRLAEPGCYGDHSRARLVADDLELVPLADRRLVDVAREDEVGSCADQRAEDVVAMRDRPFTRRPPRGSDQMMVEDGDAKGSLLCRGEPFRRSLQLSSTQSAALVAKGPSRVEPDDVEAWRRSSRLCRLPDSLELRPRTYESSWRVRKIVVSGHREYRRPE